MRHAGPLISDWLWKPLTDLTEQHDKYGYMRHLLYQDRVAGRRILEPLRAAQRFLIAYQLLP